MSWWVPLAFIGAGLAGLLIAWSLTAGRPRSDAAAAQPVHGHGAPRKSRYRQDNDLVWNPAAFVTALLLIGVLVFIAVLMEVL
jgi:hypothetical protein